MSFKSHSAYVKYFREIAEFHQDICHNPDLNETGFARIIDSGGSPFRPNYHIEEYLAKEKHDLCYPCLLVESKAERFKRLNHPYADVIGGVIILDRLEEKADFDAQEDAIQKCEGIARQIIARIKDYLSKNPGEGHMPLEQVTVRPVGPLKNLQYGVRLDFSIQIPAGVALCYDHNIWSDLADSYALLREDGGLILDEDNTYNLIFE